MTTMAEEEVGRTTQLVPWVRARVEAFHPAYFALAMATGIVSVGCELLGLRAAARLLFWVNVPAYCALWIVVLARALFFGPSLLRDCASHQRGPGFFTSVAATCVVGVQFVMLRGDSATGLALFWVALALWCVCTYGIFVALAIGDDKPALAEGINGGWLLAVVATQGLCVLGTKVMPARFGSHEAVFLFLVCLWLCGGMLYIWMIALIFYRYMFFRFAPSDLMPPYWINMGAVAISTLAGCALVSVAEDSTVLAGILPFIKGFTLMYWATATWWIPMLAILGIWRHRARRVRFRYDPLYWGLVFPLGMYSVATYRVAELLRADFLTWIARGFVVVALSAWLLTFFGMASRLVLLVLLAARSLRAFQLRARPPSLGRQPASGGPR